MATAPKPLDYTAYLKLPEIKRRYDIVDGVLTYMSPSPGWMHQTTAREVFLALHRHVARHRLGEVVFAPIDVIISRGPLRVRQPDVLFISRERLAETVQEDRIHRGPDLVIEVVSPGNMPKHIQQKLRDYAMAGVREAWIVYPRQKKIAVLNATHGELRETSTFTARQRLRSKILPGLSFTVAKAFA